MLALLFERLAKRLSFLVPPPAQLHCCPNPKHTKAISTSLSNSSFPSLLNLIREGQAIMPLPSPGDTAATLELCISSPHRQGFQISEITAPIRRSPEMVEVTKQFLNAMSPLGQVRQGGHLPVCILTVSSCKADGHSFLFRTATHCCWAHSSQVICADSQQPHLLLHLFTDYTHRGTSCGTIFH